MPDFETQILGIEYKLRQLIETKNNLKKTISELEQKNAELQSEIDNKNIVINKLEEQNKILNLGNTISNKGDSTEIKIMINRLIREIDESIEILTKVD